MSKAKAVLLVPFEGDPHGLLAEGPCDARPPVVYRSRGCGVGHPDTWQPHDEFVRRGECYMCECPEEALVLAWDGEPVWQGAVWAECVLAALDCDETPSWRLLVNRVARVLRPGGTRLSKMLRRLVGDLGTLVLLDAEGREVSDE